MSSKVCCDWCGAVFNPRRSHIKLTGYQVLYNNQEYSLSECTDFCSFDCLSKWAAEEQKILDDYLTSYDKHRGGSA